MNLGAQTCTKYPSNCLQDTLSLFPLGTSFCPAPSVNQGVLTPLPSSRPSTGPRMPPKSSRESQPQNFLVPSGKGGVSVSVYTDGDTSPEQQVPQRSC